MLWSIRSWHPVYNLFDLDILCTMYSILTSICTIYSILTSCVQSIRFWHPVYNLFDLDIHMYNLFDLDILLQYIWSWHPYNLFDLDILCTIYSILTSICTIYSILTSCVQSIRFWHPVYRCSWCNNQFSLNFL